MWTRQSVGSDAVVERRGYHVLVAGRTRDMAAGDVSEGQRRSDVDTPGRVVAAHDVRLVIAGGVQARDRLAVRAPYARMGIGPGAGERAEAARAGLVRVERTPFDLRERRG